jgi:hypothetical protein
MYSESQYLALVSTMSEAEARRIVDLISKDKQATMTEAEKAALPAAYVKADHRLHRLSEMTEADAVLTVSASVCRGCVRPSCICSHSRELFKRFYGASWCGCCGQDYSKQLDNTLFISSSYVTVGEQRRTKETGILYEKVGRLWVRVPCASCSPAYIEARAEAIEDVLEEEEFERRGRC